MKHINNLLKKYCYNEVNTNTWMPEGNSFFHEEAYPYNQYFAPGQIQDIDANIDTYENRQKDGKEFEEFNVFKRKKRREKLKKMLQSKKDRRKKDITQSAPFYSSVYGYTGLEGATSSPLEYYSGSISEEPGAITNNPYNNPYQAASARDERLKIRAMIFDDFTNPLSHIPIITNENKEELYYFHPISDPFKSLEEAKIEARRLIREGNEEIVIWHGTTKHKWYDPSQPDYREEIRHWYQVGQL